MVSTLLVIYKTMKNCQKGRTLNTSDHRHQSSLVSYTGERVISDEHPGEWNHDKDVICSCLKSGTMYVFYYEYMPALECHLQQINPSSKNNAQQTTTKKIFDSELTAKRPVLPLWHSHPITTFISCYLLVWGSLFPFDPLYTD